MKKITLYLFVALILAASAVLAQDQCNGIRDCNTCLQQPNRACIYCAGTIIVCIILIKLFSVNGFYICSLGIERNFFRVRMQIKQRDQPTIVREQWNVVR